MAVSYAELVACSSDDKPHRVHFCDSREFVGEVRAAKGSATEELWEVIDSETNVAIVFRQIEIARIGPVVQTKL
jgi:hypothetical protein